MLCVMSKSCHRQQAHAIQSSRQVSHQTFILAFSPGTWIEGSLATARLRYCGIVQAKIESPADILVVSTVCQCRLNSTLPRWPCLRLGVPGLLGEAQLALSLQHGLILVEDVEIAEISFIPNLVLHLVLPQGIIIWSRTLLREKGVDQTRTVLRIYYWCHAMLVLTTQQINFRFFTNEDVIVIPVLQERPNGKISGINIMFHDVKLINAPKRGLSPSMPVLPSLPASVGSHGRFFCRRPLRRCRGCLFCVAWPPIPSP